jgi:hypothetical protein
VISLRQLLASSTSRKQGTTNAAVVVRNDPDTVPTSTCRYSSLAVHLPPTTPSMSAPRYSFRVKNKP